MAENDFIEHKIWLVKSIEALYQVGKDNENEIKRCMEKLSGEIQQSEARIMEKLAEESNLRATKIEELKDLISTATTERTVLKTDYENKVEYIKESLSRKTNITNAIAVLVLAGATLLINLLTK